MADMRRQRLGDGDLEECGRRAHHDNAGHNLKVRQRSTTPQAREVAFAHYSR